MNWSVYGLHGADGQIRYIGSTTNAKIRLANHRQNRSGTQAKRQWIASLNACGERLGLRVLEIVESRDAAIAAEHCWTETARANGWQLVNGHGNRSASGHRPGHDLNSEIFFFRVPLSMKIQLEALAAKLNASEAEVVRCALRQFRGEA